MSWNAAYDANVMHQLDFYGSKPSLKLPDEESTHVVDQKSPQPYHLIASPWRKVFGVRWYVPLTPITLLTPVYLFRYWYAIFSTDSIMIMVTSSSGLL